jgi:hypothetical protein
VIVRVKELLGNQAKNVQLSMAMALNPHYMNGQIKIAGAVVKGSKLTSILASMASQVRG